MWIEIPVLVGLMVVLGIVLSAEEERVDVQPLWAWLCEKREDADEQYRDCVGPTHFYWLGRWAAFGEVMKFIDKEE